MKSHRIAFILFLLTLVAGCQTKSTQLYKVAIYYVPFQFASNESVSPDTIKEKANVVEITDKRTLAYLEKLLAKAKESSGFDKKKVRMLFEMKPGERSVYLDADGNLLESNRESHLPQGDFDQLQALVSQAVSTGGEMK